jgi:hypothetical protein
MEVGTLRGGELVGVELLVGGLVVGGLMVDAVVMVGADSVIWMLGLTVRSLL